MLLAMAKGHWDWPEMVMGFALHVFPHWDPQQQGWERASSCSMADGLQFVCASIQALMKGSQAKSVHL